MSNDGRPQTLRLMFAKNIVESKIANKDFEPVIPMYLRPSYAEK